MYLVLDGVPIWTHVSHRILVLVRHSRAFKTDLPSRPF